MMIEYIRYNIAAEERRKELERAYEKAQSALVASPHCLGYELSRCVEDAAHYVLRIEWDSADGHLKGFRSSPEFQEFLAAVRPFLNDVEEMRHYEATAIKREKA